MQTYFAVARDADLILACWGKNGAHMGRDEEVWKLLDRLECLKVNGSDGTPAHPLYLKKTLVPFAYQGPRNQL